MLNHIDEEGSLHELSSGEVDPFPNGALTGPPRGVTVKEGVLGAGGSLLVHILVATMVLALPLSRLPCRFDSSFVTVNLVDTAGAPGDSACKVDEAGSGSAGVSEAGRAQPQEGFGGLASQPDSDAPGEVTHLKGSSSEAAKPHKSTSFRESNGIQQARRAAPAENNVKKRSRDSKTASADNQRLLSENLKETASSSAAQNPYPKIQGTDSNGEERYGAQEGGAEKAGEGPNAGTSHSASYGSGSHRGHSNADPPDQMPAVIERIEPVYPRQALHSGICGKVVLKLFVETDGRISRPSIIEAHPKNVFEQSVLEAIRRWRFKPGYRRGSAVAAWVILTFEFEKKR